MRLPQPYDAAGLRHSRGPFITKKCLISADLQSATSFGGSMLISPSNLSCQKMRFSLFCARSAI
jgi:hypothetical protein